MFYIQKMRSIQTKMYCLVMEVYRTCIVRIILENLA